jgi:hypothetical protein
VTTLILRHELLALISHSARSPSHASFYKRCRSGKSVNHPPGTFCQLCSRSAKLAIFVLVPLPMLLLLVNFLWRSSISQAILLVQLRHGSPDYLPSNLGIALHLVFAVACICAQFAVMRDIEI